MRVMLLETTARHMQSDVPVGAFLSGGIDSSAVLAAMRRSSSQPIKAFTIGYPGDKRWMRPKPRARPHAISAASISSSRSR